MYDVDGIVSGYVPPIVAARISTRDRSFVKIMWFVRTSKNGEKKSFSVVCEGTSGSISFGCDM